MLGVRLLGLWVLGFSDSLKQTLKASPEQLSTATIQSQAALRPIEAGACATPTPTPNMGWPWIEPGLVTSRASKPKEAPKPLGDEVGKSP